MNNKLNTKLKIIIKNNTTHPLSSNDIKQINLLYKQCFQSSLSNDDSFDTYYCMLTYNKEIIGVFKIVDMIHSYELYDVCRKNPTQPFIIENINEKHIYQRFMTESINEFITYMKITKLTKLTKLTKPILLAIERENKYYNNAKKLYISVGFIHTNKHNLSYIYTIMMDVDIFILRT